MIGITSIISITNDTQDEPLFSNESPIVYVRNEYLPYWADFDHDCQDTRQEVLIIESKVDVVLSESGCEVISGSWLDPYTGQTYENPSELDIDHVVPLYEAHFSGAMEWTQDEKRQYSNDLSNPNTLIAVHNGANRSKGSSDPANWMPPNNAFHCEYITMWIDVKSQFNLEMDERESNFIENKLEECAAQQSPR